MASSASEARGTSSTVYPLIALASVENATTNVEARIIHISCILPRTPCFVDMARSNLKICEIDAVLKVKASKAPYGTVDRSIVRCMLCVNTL